MNLGDDNMYGRRLVIPATLLCALFLNVIPYPEWAKWAHPDWVTLALFYWCLALPHRVGVGYGWSLGLLLDVMQFTLFGQHAIGKALIALLVVYAYPRLRRYHIGQQCVVILLLASVDIGIVVWVQHIALGLQIHAQFWWAALSTALLWPVAYLLLRKLHRRNRLSWR